MWDCENRDLELLKEFIHNEIELYFESEMMPAIKEYFKKNYSHRTLTIVDGFDKRNERLDDIYDELHKITGY